MQAKMWYHIIMVEWKYPTKIANFLSWRFNNCKGVNSQNRKKINGKNFKSYAMKILHHTPKQFWNSEATNLRGRWNNQKISRERVNAFSGLFQQQPWIFAVRLPWQRSPRPWLLGEMQRVSRAARKWRFQWIWRIGEERAIHC